MMVKEWPKRATDFCFFPTDKVVDYLELLTKNNLREKKAFINIFYWNPLWNFRQPGGFVKHVRENYLFAIYRDGK